jgi:phosphomannomutase
MALKFGSSGVRGLYSELSPEIATNLAMAFSTYAGGGHIAVGADPRPSGKYLVDAVISGLTATGAGVHDYGILPTPVLQWITGEHEFDGAVSISGGHTSFEWNSLIFINPQGAYLNAVEVEEFFNLYHSGKYARKAYNRLGDYGAGSQHVDRYFEKLAAGGISAGRRCKFAVDCSNGAASVILGGLSNALNIDFVPLFCEGEPFFQKDPEPNLKNAGFLSTFVKEIRCDGGFLLNSDASRVLVVDETGKALSEELTLPLFARIMLEEKKTNIITTFSSSKAVDAVADRFGVKVFRTDVGPPSVVQKAVEMKAEIGGEGSGSVFFTPFSYGYDSFLFIKVMVDYLRKHDAGISTLAAEFQMPDIYKDTVFLPAEKIYAILERIDKLFPSKVKLKDGFYYEAGGGWLCVRASSTMAMIRIVGEGPGIRSEIERIKEEIR